MLLSGLCWKKRNFIFTCLVYAFFPFQSAVQDVDFENELDLLYAVVTLPDPSSDADFQCNLYFIDETSGAIMKTVPLPTWEQVRPMTWWYW